jgi:hypothetical protein
MADLNDLLAFLTFSAEDLITAPLTPPTTAGDLQRGLALMPTPTAVSLSDTALGAGYSAQFSGGTRFNIGRSERFRL